MSESTTRRGVNILCWRTIEQSSSDGLRLYQLSTIGCSLAVLGVLTAGLGLWIYFSHPFVPDFLNRGFLSPHVNTDAPIYIVLSFILLTLAYSTKESYYFSFSDRSIYFENNFFGLNIGKLLFRFDDIDSIAIQTAYLGSDSGWHYSFYLIPKSGSKVVTLSLIESDYDGLVADGRQLAEIVSCKFIPGIPEHYSEPVTFNGKTRIEYHVSLPDKRS